MWRLCSAKGILHVRVVCVVLSEKSRIHRLEIKTRLGSYILSPPIKATKLQGPKLKITRKCHKWWAAIKISNHAQADNKLFHSSALLASSSPGRRYRKCDTFRLENSICIVCGRGCVCVCENVKVSILSMVWCTPNTISFTTFTTRRILIFCVFFAERLDKLMAFLNSLKLHISHLNRPQKRTDRACYNHPTKSGYK